MVTVKTQYNLKNAKEYFEEHLCVGEYYDEGKQVTTRERGAGFRNPNLDQATFSVPVS